MKLRTSVAAMILALSATIAWAGDTGQAPPDMGQPEVTGMEQSSNPNAANEPSGWKYLNGQAAGSENQGSTDQSAMSEDQSESDQAADSADQSGSNETAMTDDQSESDHAAASEDQSGTDQTANSEEQNSDDQSARSEDQDESDQAADSEDPGADLKDKVVVLIPRGWKGSIPDLITALKSSPDAADIVVVQQGEPRARNSSDHSPVAKMTHAIHK